MIKSPLRYPGGKSRAVKEITSFLPQTGELVSPFIGGGSIELDCASRGIRVYGSDAFKPLVSFWRELQSNQEKLAQEVEKFHPLDRDSFYKLQQKHKDECSFEQAVLFYVLNRSSFSGATLSGGCSRESLAKRFTLSSIQRLREFPKLPSLSVVDCDFEEALCSYPNVPAYLDPPYLVKSKLYGLKGDRHKDFDHYRLYKLLLDRKDWILSYNNCSAILELYSSYKIVYPNWSYGMSKDKSSKEVLIINEG